METYEGNIRDGDRCFDLYVGDVYVCSFFTHGEALVTRAMLGIVRANSPNEAFLNARAKVDKVTESLGN